jgi:hypothetical protein
MQEVSRMPFGGNDDFVVLDRAFGVALGGDDHRYREARVPGERGRGGEIAGGGGVEQAGERGGEPVQQDLGLRVAEARVELDHLDALAGQREARIEDAAVGDPEAAHGVDGGLDDSVHDLADQSGRRPGERGVGAHAAGVRALVTVAGALEVLRGQQWHRRGSVREGEQADLRAVEVLLDNHLRAALRVLAGGLEVGGDQDALARREGVVLDDIGRAELL